MILDDLGTLLNRLIKEQVDQRVTELLLAERADRDGEGWPAALNIETAARYLDSSPERLRKLVAARRIPFVQEASGCAVRFLRADLDEWLREHRHEARRSSR
jgi:excisionase family DNA binding protein